MKAAKQTSFELMLVGQDWIVAKQLKCLGGVIQDETIAIKTVLENLKNSFESEYGRVHKVFLNHDGILFFDLFFDQVVSKINTMLKNSGFDDNVQFCLEEINLCLEDLTLSF